MHGSDFPQRKLTGSPYIAGRNFLF